MDKPLARILVVDDDDEIRSLLQVVLTREGFDVQLAKDAPTARKILGARNGVDLIILDIMMPGEDGLSFCQRLRETQDTPILMVSARTLSIDRSIGLEMGADDYLPKPFEPRELLARLKAILRRRNGEARPDLLRFGRLQIDPAALEVRLDGEPRALTSHQFALLLVLARHAGRVMSRDAIMDALKHEPLEAFDRSIDVHVSRIRAAIEDNPKKPRRVITVRGAGYVFAKVQD
jgi:two-component system, OmpR family, phosphate regulon response regulator OmpR